MRISTTNQSNQIKSNLIGIFIFFTNDCFNIKKNYAFKSYIF